MDEQKRPRVRFQSLVGRLETTNAEREFVQVMGFQSLVGRLETQNRLQGAFLSVGFQSLVGRLETQYPDHWWFYRDGFNPS